jgi:hypothetical protein
MLKLIKTLVFSLNLANIFGMKPLLTLPFLLLFLSCAVAPVPEPKINGVSFVASRVAVDTSHINPILSIHANAASIMPFGFIRDVNHPEVIYNSDRQWFGETKEGAEHYITELHNNGISIMLKPQIWIQRGEFTGNLVMTSEENWRLLEESYSRFVLDYAQVAEDMQVDVFCIGTELELFIKNRPEYWRQLITKIRQIYKGSLTYAANWDEFWRTPFWEELDYIGIDAYFPISEAQTPSVEDCLRGWNKHKEQLSRFSEEWDRPILFTEFGYRSVDYAAREPWRYDRSMTSINLQAQTNATQALFESVWMEPWFAGGYLWKWFVNHDKVGGHENNQFTPQNKPVEQLIGAYYQQFN